MNFHNDIDYIAEIELEVVRLNGAQHLHIEMTSADKRFKEEFIPLDGRDVGCAEAVDVFFISDPHTLD